jgi:hypothetical protein
VNDFIGGQNWKHWSSKFKTLILEIMGEQQCYNIQVVAIFMISKKFLESFLHVAKTLNFVAS